LAVCAVLAMILNAGAIGIASKVTLYSPAVARLAIERPRTVTMVLASAPPDEPAPIDVPQAAAPSANASNKLPGPPTHVRAARTTPNIADAEPLHPALFYAFREVDSPAFPPDDWNLDAQSLERIGVQRLVFEVLVSDRGDVVGCTVLEPSDLPDDVKVSLEKRLSETPLLPALRAGQFVASARRIELTVTDALPDLQVDAPAHQP